MVWLLSLAMLINRAGSMLIAFMSIYLTKELGYSNAKAGWVMAGFGLGSIIGSYFGGRLADKVGYYKIMLGSLALGGFVLLPLPYVHSIGWVWIIVFAYSTISEMFRPANALAVANYADEENLTRSYSLIRLAINLGFTVGPALGGIIALLLGYKLLFLLDSLTSFFAAILLWMYLPKPKPIKEKLQHTVKTGAVWTDKIFLLFLIRVMVFGSIFFQLFSSVPVFFAKEYHYREDLIGYLLALNGLFVVILELPLISYIERKANPNTFIALGCSMITISFIVLYFSNGNVPLVILYTLFITLAEIFAMPFMMNYVINRAGQDRKGEYLGMYSVAYGIAHIVAPSAGLGLSDLYGFTHFYLAAGLVALLLAISFLRSE
jgi:predicted MFS family arabinose efflux permease